MCFYYRRVVLRWCERFLIEVSVVGNNVSFFCHTKKNVLQSVKFCDWDQTSKEELPLICSQKA